MASLLRQIVAGPRARHPEAGLDLCYVTDNIIATSGPSQTYPQRAYRNPLDRVVAFLDAKHGDNWAIWEFRAEGTGYPDELVYNRIRHYPWPDHHPPPFRVVPLIVASMRNWLNGGNLGTDTAEAPHHPADETKKENDEARLTGKIVNAWKESSSSSSNSNSNSNSKKNDRVVVVHCKAGKGRSGTIACSYLIAECGWTPEQALARFTERRMRPRMGPGVSIPSQLRTIGYVERWARRGGRGGQRVYVDRPVEVLEIHVWGLRNGVRIDVEGYADEGKRIRVFHTFSKKERHVVEGDPPGGAGVVDMVYDMAGYSPVGGPEQEVLDETRGVDGKRSEANTWINFPDRAGSPSSTRSIKEKMNKRASTLISKVSRNASKSGTSSPTGLDTKSTESSPASSSSPLPLDKDKNQGPNGSTSNSINNTSNSSSTINETPEEEQEPGGRAVIFKPRRGPIRIPNSDVNITVERRNRAPRSVGLTMVTAVAHVWFNAFFEGNGPEQDGRADPAGVFEIDWEKMDGIKGSSQKGTRAFDRIAVVWRVAPPPAADESGKQEGGERRAGEEGGEGVGEVIEEPGIDAPVPQLRPADWKGGSLQDPDAEKHLGLRGQSPDSAGVSRASSSSTVSLRNGGEGKIQQAVERKVGQAEDELELGSVRSDVP